MKTHVRSLVYVSVNTILDIQLYEYLNLIQLRKIYSLKSTNHSVPVEIFDSFHYLYLLQPSVLSQSHQADGLFLPNLQPRNKALVAEHSNNAVHRVILLAAKNINKHMLKQFMGSGL